MLKIHGDRFGHEKFKKLCALAASGNLSPFEAPELEAHLGECEECREVLVQYRALTTEGLITLADIFTEKQEPSSWKSEPALRNLLAQVRADPQSAVAQRRSIVSADHATKSSYLLRRPAARTAAALALAACAMLMIGFGGFRLGAAKRQQSTVVLAPASAADSGLGKLADEKKAVDQLLAAQVAKVAQLQLQGAEKEKELIKLQSMLEELKQQSSVSAAASSQSAAELQTVSQERDALNARLQALSQSFENDKAQLAALRTEREQTALRTESLEKEITELTATNNDQERRLKDTEQYLTSDRDIRELMGARKLYIADVFDVDGSSRTKKPFGRVFYTQGKSLIFYAFDLDRKPGVVNASAFQVWGQKEGPQGQQASPMNLGILYMDNETNRRWVMRFDEPKQLAEIDAVFVTVEPSGGSHKPTSKPFLYALLRNEANHP
jgi:hypothetical protein